MSSIPRLPFILSKLIEDQWIKNQTTSESLAPADVSTNLPQPTPFLCFFTGSAISDGFYTIPATSQISLSTNSYILLNRYTLSYTTHLHLTITSADLQPTTPKFDGPTIGIEKNPLIANTIRRYKFLRLQSALNESIFDNTEDSEKFLINLSKMNESLNNPEESHNEDQGSDILEKKTGDLDKVLQMVRQEKPLGKVIEVSYNLGIDVFPSYALEYLKHKYNVV
jgi:hypothetical protein